MQYCITHTASDFLKLDFQAILLVLVPLSTLLPEITGTANSWASWRILWYKLVAFLLSQNSSLGVWVFRSAKSLTIHPKASQVPKFFAVIAFLLVLAGQRSQKLSIAFFLEAATVSMLNLPLYLRIFASITGEKQYLSVILIYIFHIVSILESPFYFAFKSSKYFVLGKYSFSHWTKVFFLSIYKSSLYLRNQLSVIWDANIFPCLYSVYRGSAT